MNDGTPELPDGEAARRFQRADALLDELLDLDESERNAYLSHLTGVDPTLKHEVARLLGAVGALPPHFLGNTAMDVAGPLLTAPHMGTGSQVAHFRLQRLLGEGGMGVVWLARDERLARDVALKIVRGSLRLTADGGNTDRTQAEREARAVAKLDHPHVAGVYEFGETSDGVLWISMPYCAGGSLADRLRRGPLEVREVLRVSRELASALAAAHAERFIHRDVKPPNVLFDAAGRVRLADFGTAKLIDGESTRGSGLVGTVAYLSPEQIAGHDVDHRADLWALGVSMYEMLSGRRPFEGDGYAAILHAIVTRPAPPLPQRPSLPPALVELVTSLLQKDPARRPVSAAAVEAELVAIADGRGGTSRPATTGVSAVTRRTVTGLALVACLGLVFVVRGTPTTSATPITPTTATASVESRPPIDDLGTADPVAREAFLQGRYERVKRNPASLALAAAHFQRAVARDSSFARAWAALANTMVLQALFGNAPMTTILPKARAMAWRALAMDSSVAEIHAAVAHVLRVYDLDWTGSLRASSRAMQLDPADESVAVQHAITLLDLRRFAEAESLMVAARAMDPANPSHDLTLGRIQAATGRYAAADSSFRRVLAVQDRFEFAHEQLGYVQLAEGRRAEALASFRRAAALSGSRDSAHLAYALAVTGQQAEARRIVQAIMASESQRYVQPIPVAAAWTGLGDHDRAFEWLERAWRDRAFGLDAVAVSAPFHALRNDPRWRQFLRQRVGIPPTR